MDFLEFTAGLDDDGRRLDRIIKKLLKNENLSGLYKAIRKGLIKVNEEKKSPSDKIFKGDKIKIADFLVPKQNSKEINAEKNTYKPDFKIVFENQDILIINKPYNKTVQGEKDSLNNKIVEYYNATRNKNESISFTPGPLHRLDRKTTGLLAFSMSLKGAKWFSENLKNHKITKIYWGIVQGKLQKSEKWNDFIKKDFSFNNSFQTVKISKKNNEDFLDSKNSVTEVVPLKYLTLFNTECTLVQFHIFTGRTHQIRSQSAFHGFPLLGDISYGGKKINAKQDFFLHAETLIFPQERLAGLPEKIELKPEWIIHNA